jgi:hypothetical protein
MTEIQKRNYLAIFFIILAKINGFAGIASGYYNHRTAGLFLFILAFISIIISCILAILNISFLNKEQDEAQINA